MQVNKNNLIAVFSMSFVVFAKYFYTGMCLLIVNVFTLGCCVLDEGMCLQYEGQTRTDAML